MVNSQDVLINRHIHIADAIGFFVPLEVLSQLNISGVGPFVGRAVRCSVGEHESYVAVANMNGDGENVAASDFEAAVSAAIIAHFS